MIAAVATEPKTETDAPSFSDVALVTPVPVRSGNRLYKTLDAWRGLAALAVVFYHVTETLKIRHAEIADQGLYRFASFGAMGVELFFVISGYCIAAAAVGHCERRVPLKDFVIARLRRIYPAYWVSLVCVAAVAYGTSLLLQRGVLHESASAHLFAQHPSPLWYLANIGLLQSLLGMPSMNTVAWTLCYEIAFYLICAAALAITIRRINPIRAHRTMDILHILTIGTAAALLLFPGRMFYPLDMWVFFGLGVLVFDRLRRPNAKLPLIALTTTAVLLLLYALYFSVSLGTGNQPSRWAVWSALPFALLLLPLYRNDERVARHPLVRPFASVGQFSYSLYLIHFLCIGLVSQIVARFAGLDRLPLLTCIIMFAVSLGTAWCFYLLFERPFLKSAKRTPSKAASAVQLTSDLP